MSTTAPTTPKPRRRWLQFSLRTLMVLMLVLGCGLSWLAREVQQARAQREAAKAIGKLGGRVSCLPPTGGMVRTAVAWVGGRRQRRHTGGLTPPIRQDVYLLRPAA